MRFGLSLSLSLVKQNGTGKLFTYLHCWFDYFSSANFVEHARKRHLFHGMFNFIICWKLRPLSIHWLWPMESKPMWFILRFCCCRRKKRENCAALFQTRICMRKESWLWTNDIYSPTNMVILSYRMPLSLPFQRKFRILCQYFLLLLNWLFKQPFRLFLNILWPFSRLLWLRSTLSVFNFHFF